MNRGQGRLEAARRWSLATCAVVALWFAGCASGPRIISGFGDLWLAGFPRRDGPHNGIDIAGSVGDPILAAADGFVVFAGELNPVCGIGVRIDHGSGGQTIYCHLSQATEALVGVKRGDVIGYLGTTGSKPPAAGLEHVHFSVWVGGTPVDPAKFIVGCFDAKRSYPVDGPALTYPVRC